MEEVHHSLLSTAEHDVVNLAIKNNDYISLFILYIKNNINFNNHSIILYTLLIYLLI